MIRCTAVGCSNLVPPADAWMRRSGDELVIGCYTSRQTWQLTCQHRRWIGVLSNCTTSTIHRFTMLHRWDVAELLCPPRERCKVLWWVCPFVYPLVYLENRTAKLQEICHACCPWPWLSSAVRWRCDTVCTSGFVVDVVYSHNDSMARYVYS